MKITEFIGGFVSGISVLFISLGVIFLDKIDTNSASQGGYIYLELIIPYFAALIAGIGLGFGLKSDEGGIGYSFSLDFGEQLPTLIGALALAGVFGLSFIFYISNTPPLGLFLELIGSLLATFGLLIIIVSWDSFDY
jgi:hypothetical protein